jgi:alpha-glucosidase
MKNLIRLNLFLLIILITSCSQSLMVKSPDNNNSITLELNKDGTLFYSIQSHRINAVSKSLMGVDITDPMLDFNSGLSNEGVQKSVIDETYSLPTGKTSVYINKANQSVFTFKNRHKKVIRVICRAYNDGIAFRYVIDSPAGVTVRKEFTRFQIPDKTMSWIMDYVPNYENIYQENTGRPG